MRFRRCAPLLATLVCLGLAGVAGAQATPPEGDLRGASDHVLVKVSPESSASAVLEGDSRPLFGGWHRVPIAPASNAREAVATLSNNPHVEEVSLDPVVQLDPVQPTKVDMSAGASAPNDPYYSYQWHFPPLQLEEAWTRSTGADMVVAVVDTGISMGGDDLACHTFVHPYNAITGSESLSGVEDDHGHGTHVAGTVAQCTGNGIGTAGVAIDADLMPVKVLDSIGNGNISNVAAGVDWARAHGADVINLSLGSPCQADTWPACSEEILNDAIEAALAEDIVIVAAAGNDGTGFISHPANHPEVIAVGAVDINLDLTSYSNRGPDLDVVAPGGNTNADVNGDGVVDGVVQETFRGSDGWAYYAFQGTSMATPHVSAAAALLRSAFPDADREDIADALIATTRDLGSAGIDSTFGNGLIQMSDAVDALVALDSSAPTWPSGATLSVTETGGGESEVSWPEATDDLGVVAYRVFVEGETVASVKAHQTSTRISGLTEAQSTSIAVRAFDAAGNRSAPLTVSDAVDPTWPADARVEVTAHAENSIGLTWPAASDNVEMSEYGVRVGGNDVLATSSPGATVTGLDSGETYELEIVARDHAGNTSDPLEVTARTAGSFLDTADTVFYQDILWLSAHEVTRGCNPPQNDRYCPNDPLTRGQMAAFLTRALDLTPTTSAATITFQDATTSVFQTDIAALAATGITRGCNPPQNDRYCPDDPLTRGQMAAFLTRALDLTPTTRAAPITFQDATTSVFQTDIAALAATGITRGCNPPENDRFCPDDPVTRGQMAAFLARALAG